MVMVVVEWLPDASVLDTGLSLADGVDDISSLFCFSLAQRSLREIYKKRDEKEKGLFGLQNEGLHTRKWA